MKPKGKGCSGCPAEKVGKSFVRPVGPRDARIAICGQGPGEDEAWAGLPFVGRSGTMLNDWMHRAGLRRSEVRIMNIVWCWLPGNRAPKADEVAFCREAHWQKELDDMPELKVVVPVGIPAAKAFLGKASMNTAGQVVEVEEF